MVNNSAPLRAIARTRATKTRRQRGTGDNGGPPLELCSRGRPSISTPEIRDRVLDMLGDGVPLRAICRMTGLPSRGTIYNWCKSDSDFHRLFKFFRHEGYIGLVEFVCDETERLLDEGAVKEARRLFSLRRQHLARMSPRFFGGKDMKPWIA